MGQHVTPHSRDGARPETISRSRACAAAHSGAPADREDSIRLPTPTLLTGPPRFALPATVVVAATPATPSPGAPTPTPGRNTDSGAPTPTPGVTPTPGDPTPTPGVTPTPGAPAPTVERRATRRRSRVSRGGRRRLPRWQRSPPHRQRRDRESATCGRASHGFVPPAADCGSSSRSPRASGSSFFAPAGAAKKRRPPRARRRSSSS